MRYPSLLYKPAMEAEDITKEINQLNKTVSDDGPKNDTIDTSNTDDIFDTKKKSGISKPTDNNSPNKPKEDEPEQPTDTDTMEEPESDNITNIDGDNEVDDSEVDSMGDDEEGGDLPEPEKKMKLKNKLVLLHNLFLSSINTLNTAAGDINDVELTIAFAKSKEYMSFAKNRIYEIITIDLKKDSYPILLKKYIGLCRFHDVCASFIDKSMDKYEESINKTVFTRKKKKSTK